MKQYLDLLKDVLENGDQKGDRTGTGTISKFGAQMRFDLSKGFPLLTTKKLHIPSIVHELLWFISGDTNSETLMKNGVRIWQEWALKQDEFKCIDLLPPMRLDFAIKNNILNMDPVEFKRKYNGDNLEMGMSYLDSVGVPRKQEVIIRKKGDLGPIYGKQWRRWLARDGRVIDQLGEVIEEIKNNPNSRRLIVSAWNVGELDKMHLPPCHLLFQFYVNDGKLSCQLYQRSVDTFLGLPFNIASYSLLVYMIAQVTGLEVGEFIWTGGDVHIYNNHIEQVKEQLTREPKELCQLKINPNINNIDDFTFDDFEFVNYEAHPHIKGKVAV